jgi:hypothetical protein
MDKNKKLHPAARYFLNLALAVDQLGNVLLGGDEDETISSRLGKIERHHGGKIPKRRIFSRAVSWGLDKIDPGHCREAIEEDEGKNAVFDRFYNPDNCEAG